MTPAEAEPASASDASDVARMFAGIAARYDRANRVLSLGRDVGWRRRLIHRASPDANDVVVDVCTGTADLVRDFLHAHPSLSVYGVDFARPMLAAGQSKLDRQWDHAVLLEGDALHLPFADASVDVVSIAFGLRNLIDYPMGIREMSRVLRPGGRLTILEFATPPSRLVRALYFPYLRHVLPRLGGWITGDPSAYSYLDRTVRAFPSPDAIAGMMTSAGLVEVAYERLTMGIAVLYRGRQPEARHTP